MRAEGERGGMTYIIAEIGSNWGTLEDCLLSIRAAKATGSDAVKFQLFTHEALYGFPQLMHHELPMEWLEPLKGECDRVGIDFLCTAFSPELLDTVDPFVKAHKIASAELTHVRLLERAAQKGKPVYLSTGASSIPEIDEALTYLRDVPVTLLYCEAAYPAKYVDLNCIKRLAEYYLKPIGFSDHTSSVIEIPRHAAELGAAVIEKHGQFVDGHFPDSGHSLSQKEFTDMVKAIRGDYPTRIGWTPGEQEMISSHRRRLKAIRVIQRGDPLIEGENFGIFRSAYPDPVALPGFAAPRVNGKRATVRLEIGQGIGPRDFSY